MDLYLFFFFFLKTVTNS